MGEHLLESEALAREFGFGLPAGVRLIAADDPEVHAFRGRPRLDHLMPILGLLQGDIVGRDAVAPPQLPRYAPIPDVVQPPGK